MFGSRSTYLGRPRHRAAPGQHGVARARAGADHAPVTSILERDDLLAVLEDELAAGGRFVFVGGEAGVGKTTLVRELAGRASVRVLRGSCENLTTPTPLGPFVDLAADAGEPLAGGRRRPRGNAQTRWKHRNSRRQQQESAHGSPQQHRGHIVLKERG